MRREALSLHAHMLSNDGVVTDTERELWASSMDDQVYGELSELVESEGCILIRTSQALMMVPTISSPLRGSLPTEMQNMTAENKHLINLIGLLIIGHFFAGEDESLATYDFVTKEDLMHMLNELFSAIESAKPNEEDDARFGLQAKSSTDRWLSLTEGQADTKAWSKSRYGLLNKAISHLEQMGIVRQGDNGKTIRETEKARILLPLCLSRVREKEVFDYIDGLIGQKEG